MSLATAAHTAVDAEHPWLGLASFNEETLAYFYGREDEVAELGRRVQRKLLTVLFGQSGLGKTSILRAGIVPRLRPQGYSPVYVRIDYGRDAPAPAEQIKQAILRETLSSGTWSQTGAAVEGESLWEFLHHRDDMLKDATGRPLTPLLIFDQFEEIFTLAQSDDFGRQRAAQFLDDLADLVENRPPKALEALLDSDDSAAERFDFARSDYRILIALREDYLAHLEGLKSAMPSITQNRMRLARMTGTQALDAVIKPGGRLVSQEVAEAIVRFVAGGAELRNAEVEPSLLSLICRELNVARIAQGKSEISADLLAGSHATILAEFYQRALADQPAGVHRFIEEELLTDGGFRENIAQERVSKAFAEAGAASDALAKLVDRRLLRIEERLDIRRVELTHDVLCSVVLASRDLRHEREALDAAEKQIAEQRSREAATHKALVRARKIAAACAALAVLAVGAGAFGFYGMQQAQGTRAMAETARGESERLVVYLLDDFYRELEPVGRLDLVADLARRAIDYYKSLPAELQTPATERNRALAQVRYAGALRTQSKLAEARQVIDDAIGTLDQQFQQGDRSEPTVIGLSMALATRSRVSDSGGRDAESMPPAVRSVEVLQAQAKASGASVPLRRAYANAQWRLGFAQMRQGQEETAIDTLESSVAVLRGIDGLSLADLDAATQFAEASGWLAQAYSSLGRTDASRTVALEGREVASRILEQRPTHHLALRARALLTSSLSGSAGDDLRNADRLALDLEAVRDWRTLATVDPTNAISWNNLANSRNDAGGALRDLGRWREAIDKLRENRDVEPIASARGLPSNIMIYSHGSAAFLSGQLGDFAGAKLHLKEMNRHASLFDKRLAPGSFDAEAFAGEVAIYNFEIAFAMGDEAGMREATAGQLERLEGLKPSSEGQQRRQTFLLNRHHRNLGRAALHRGDVQAAVQALRDCQVQREKLPTRAVEARLTAAEEAVLLAAALARSGRVDEARETISPALRFLREVERRNVDDRGQQLVLAQALYASALSEPAQAKVALDEAQTLFNALPPDMRNARTVRWWGERIAETQRSGR